MRWSVIVLVALSTPGLARPQERPAYESTLVFNIDKLTPEMFDRASRQEQEEVCLQIAFFRKEQYEARRPRLYTFPRRLDETQPAVLQDEAVARLEKLSRVLRDRIYATRVLKDRTQLLGGAEDDLESELDHIRFLNSYHLPHRPKGADPLEHLENLSRLVTEEIRTVKESIHTAAIEVDQAGWQLEEPGVEYAAEKCGVLGLPDESTARAYGVLWPYDSAGASEQPAEEPASAPPPRASAGPLPVRYFPAGHPFAGNPILTDDVITRWLRGSYAAAKSGGGYWQAAAMTLQDFQAVKGRISSFLYFAAPPRSEAELKAHFSAEELTALDARAKDLSNAWAGNWSEVERM